LSGFDLILCGVQAPDELEGQVSALVASALGVPHVSVVTGTKPSGSGLTVTKEFWGGLTAEYEVRLPAVLGVQAAREAPRYVAVSRIRQAQQAGPLNEVDVEIPSSESRITITEMRVPESGEHAEMIGGDEIAAAERIVEIIRQAGVG
jgi:electron transfer flavoprotein beta subunit